MDENYKLNSGLIVPESVSNLAMARQREFDKQSALEAAILVFREHGYAGASAELLTKRMKISRQSLYDTFGDKWQLYVAAVRFYSITERDAHVAELRSSDRAIEGVVKMIERVVQEASTVCLGVASTGEFGCTSKELNDLRRENGSTISRALADCLRQSQREGDLSLDLDVETTTGFIMASIAGIRLAARAGATTSLLGDLGQSVVNALR